MIISPKYHYVLYHDQYSICRPAVSTLDFPAVDRSSNHDSGKILMSENLRLYTTSPVVIS